MWRLPGDQNDGCWVDVAMWQDWHGKHAVRTALELIVHLTQDKEVTGCVRSKGKQHQFHMDLKAMCLTYLSDKST